MKTHNILDELVVNTDHMGIHFVPIDEARTWDKQNSKHVKVQGIEDKCQVIVVVSSTANGNILHFQVIF